MDPSTRAIPSAPPAARTALVIGGGIAGPVTAMALRKAGIGATVHEAYPAPADDVGAFLSLFANGMDALRAIGAERAVLERSFAADRVEFVSGTGRLLGGVPLGSGGDSGDGGTVGGAAEPAVLSPRTLKRATLYKALQDEAVRRGIRVAYGKRLTGALTTPEGRVRATFEDGGSAEADLLVGADGLRSVSRTLIDPGAPRPRYTGSNVVCGYTRDAPARAAAAPGTFRMLYGKRAFFAHITAPDGGIWWFINIPAPELTGAELAATTPEQWRARLTGLVARDGTAASAIIGATGVDITASNAYDLGAAAPRWHAPGMVLVGDAAHAASPNAGHGASMAIEDGVVLAKCLRDVPGTREACAVYERLRKERTQRLLETSAKMARRAAPGPVGRVLRDLMLPRVLGRGPRNAQAWLTGHHIEWDEPVAEQEPGRPGGPPPG